MGCLVGTCIGCWRATVPGRMHHLGIGRRHTGTRVLAITDETTATVIDLHTGDNLSEHHINPTHGYWRNQLQPPGRWPHKRHRQSGG